MQDVTNDLGYAVHVATARLRIEGLQFTQAGELHMAEAWPRSWRWPWSSTAYAHPGHYQGGEITGELPGNFVLDFTAPPTVLGEATLIAGSYESANFSLGVASEADGLAASDALLGHTALLEGTASKDGRELRFRAVIDSPAGRQIVGVPFALRVRGTTEARLVLRLLTRDPLEQDTLFDGLDFGALADASGSVELSASQRSEAANQAYELLKRTLQTHDHFSVAAEEGGP